MKNKSSKANIFEIAGQFFIKLATAIVSGLPREKYIMKPENERTVESKPKNLKSDDEKHYHRPSSRRAVEKQTLLKEKKK